MDELLLNAISSNDMATIRKQLCDDSEGFDISFLKLLALSDEFKVAESTLLKCLELLKDDDANINKLIEDKTLLMRAAEIGNEKLINILLKAGADRTRFNSQGLTAYDLALSNVIDSLSYSFNPHKHVKIWLSKTPSVFMNAENQLLLVQMRATNPKDIIHLVYDSRLLTIESHQKLHKFCLQHNIIPKDIPTDIMPFCEGNGMETSLLSFYEGEITHLHEGGNPAAASDILRWISPVYTLGIYSDFDIRVNTSKLDDTILVHSDILLDIGDDYINNDIIAVVDPLSKNIIKVQEQLMLNYSGNRLPFEYRAQIDSILDGIAQLSDSDLHDLPDEIHQLHEVFVTQGRSAAYQKLYMENVLVSSGPACVDDAFHPSQQLPDEEWILQNKAHRKLRAFGGDASLREAFSLGGVKFQHLSWMDAGKKRIHARESVLDSQASIIQKKYKEFVKCKRTNDIQPDSNASFASDEVDTQNFSKKQ